MIDETREQWLKDIDAYFKSVKSYNTTVISIGYATYFGLLVFLHDATRAKSALMFWSGLFVAISAIIFVAYELITNIKLSLETRKAGAEGRRFFRFWAFFFIPSLLLAAAGILILVIMFLRELRA
jgi:hypothetical protein